MTMTLYAPNITSGQYKVRDKRIARLSELTKSGLQNDFVHLHGHDYHSVRDAVSKPKALMKKVKEYGMKAVSVTNHGNANGWIEEAEAAKDAEVKFIPGVEMYEVENRLVKTKAEMVQFGYGCYHLVLLAITKEGYYNLIKIISEAGTNGRGSNGKNKIVQRIDMQYIKDNGLGKGIRALSACLGGRVATHAMNGDVDQAVKVMKEYREIFDEAYVEIQDSRVTEQEMFNHIAVTEIAPRSECPLILTRDYHYIEKEHGEYHDTYISFAWGKQKDSCIPKYVSKDAYYLGSPQEAWDYINEHGYPVEAIYNTIEIGEACEAEIVLGGQFFPKYPKLPEGYTERTYLRKIAHEGLIEYFDWCVKHGSSIDVNEYMDRLAYELAIITPKGYDGYFLIIWDIINWCNQNGIITGPGRGSAAGSLLSFAMKITRLDPIERGLMFERFLNPYRNSPPDIDFDVPSRHRYKVMAYVLDTYGEEYVSQIINYGTWGLRSAINGLFKALHNPDDETCIYTPDLQQQILSCIPSKMPDQGDIDLERLTDIAANPDKYIEEWGEKKSKRVIEQSTEFMAYMHRYPFLHDHMKVLEGSITQTGLHAAGVLISPKPVKDYFPIELSSSDTAVLPVCCWDSHYVEMAGGMKMDFLGLTTLDVVDICFEQIEAVEGKRPDMYEIGREDPDVFKMICSGGTHGVFQIGGDGLTAYLKQAQPQDMDAWCDVIALYRPGPLDAKVDKSTTFAQRYVENGSIPKEEYERELHPTLAQIYSRTRGVLVYQEQIMQICQDIAGYSLGDADTFRRIIGKKKISQIKAMRYQFLYGGEDGIKEVERLLKENHTEEERKGLEDALDVLKHNKNHAKGALAVGKMTLDELNTLYDQLVKFAGYAFNRSHSDVYADLGYVTGWCKSKYPAQFMAAILTMEGDSKKMDEHYAEVRKLGIPLLLPDVNKSKVGYTTEYVEVEKEDGSKVVVWGIRMGITAITSVGPKAAQAIIDGRQNGAYQDTQDFGVKIDKRVCNRGIVDRLIFAGAFDELESNRHAVFNDYHFLVLKDKDDGSKAVTRMDESSFDTKQALEYEKKHLGLYISSHPFDNLPYIPLSSVLDNETVDIGGQILNIKKVKTKRGDQMAFVSVQTQNEKFDVTLFPRTWEEYSDRLWKEGIMTFRVKKQVKSDKTDWICEKVLIPKKAQIGNATAAERPDDVPKKDKKAARKKQQMTLEDLGGVDVKDDPLLAMFD